MKRVNIELSEALHASSKVIAVLKDITMQQFLAEAINDAVEKDRKLLDKLRMGKWIFVQVLAEVILSPVFSNCTLMTY